MAPAPGDRTTPDRSSSTLPREKGGLRADRATIYRVLGGDREAFRELIERYQSQVFHAVNRIVRDPDEAEDVAQDTFVKAYTNLAKYDSRWRFSTWIGTIATRTALNAVRKQRGRTTMSVEDLTIEPRDAHGPDAAHPAAFGKGPRGKAMQSQWLRHLRREVNALSDRMRTVFGLRYEDDLSIAEIARATRSTESAVKVCLHRARKILRNRLQEFSDLA